MSLDHLQAICNKLSRTTRVSKLNITFRPQKLIKWNFFCVKTIASPLLFMTSLCSTQTKFFSYRHPVFKIVFKSRSLCFFGVYFHIIPNFDSNVSQNSKCIYSTNNQFHFSVTQYFSVKNQFHLHTKISTFRVPSLSYPKSILTIKDKILLWFLVTYTNVIPQSIPIYFYI